MRGDMAGTGHTNMLCSAVDCLHRWAVEGEPEFPLACPRCGTEFVGAVETVVTVSTVVPTASTILWDLT